MKFVYNLFFFAGLFMVSFMISDSSLNMTSHIISVYDQNAAVNGGPTTTPVGALSILFLIITFHVLCVTLLAKMVKGVYTLVKNGGRWTPLPPAITIDGYVEAPSAPPSKDGNAGSPRAFTPSHVQLSTNSLVTPSSSRPKQVWGRWNITTPTMFSGRRNGGYAPVHGDDQDGGNEMITVTSPQVYTNGVAVPQQYVLLPMNANANPVTKVSFV
jgi:hypothetical protein